jgi:hypothetical protein
LSKEGENIAEQLMSALINKMEAMDAGLNNLRLENAELKKMVANPAAMMKRAGFVSMSTDRPHDVIGDVFRGDVGDSILKGQDGADISVPTTNADFHKMDWSDIHALADQAKDSGSVGNKLGME